MNMKHVEDDLEEMLYKHGIGHMVVLFRNKQTLCIRALAQTEIDAHAAAILGNAIQEVIASHPEIRDAVNMLPEERR